MIIKSYHKSFFVIVNMLAIGMIVLIISYYMPMESCLFCDIVEGKKFGAKIYEDENVVAILDKFPNTEGMALVLPKEHHDSYVFDMPDQQYMAYLSSTKKVAKLLEEALNVERVAMVMEGM